MSDQAWALPIAAGGLRHPAPGKAIQRSTRSCLQLLAAIAVGAMTGCTGNMHDLQHYVQQVEARKGGAIEALPQIEPYETFTYKDDDSRSPFTPTKEQARGFANDGVHPDRNRPKQYLEQFPLDGLKMVGTLAVNDVNYALIKDSNNIVTRIAQGDYMGQNDGRVVKISEAGIKLSEIISNGLGGWTQRQAQLPLSD